MLGDGEARELDGPEVVLAPRRRVPDVAHHPDAARHRCSGTGTGPGGRRPDRSRGEETGTGGADAGQSIGLDTTARSDSEN